MKIFVLTFVLFLQLSSNFATDDDSLDSSSEEELQEQTDPNVCGLQLALDGAWDKSGIHIHEPWAPRYSFDANKNKCIKFNRGGLGNNNNFFYAKKSCSKLCKPWNLKRSEEKQQDIIGNPTDPEVCSLQTALDGAWKVDEATGKPIKSVTSPALSPPRYSFHANSNRCKKFNSSGHGNNKNSFADKKACLKLCRAWNIERSMDDINEFIHPDDE